MPIESAADRASFFDASEFGALVVWQTSTGAQPAFAAMFISHSMMLDEFEGPSAQNAAAALLVATELLPSGAFAGDGADGDRVSVTDPITGVATAYFAKSIEPDGTGMMRVMLEKDLG